MWALFHISKRSALGENSYWCPGEEPDSMHHSQVAKLQPYTCRYWKEGNLVAHVKKRKQHQREEKQWDFSLLCPLTETGSWLEVHSGKDIVLHLNRARWPGETSIGKKPQKLIKPPAIHLKQQQSLLGKLLGRRYYCWIWGISSKIAT